MEKEKMPPNRGPKGGPMMGAQKIEKPKNAKETTKKLINNYLSKYKILIIIVFIFSVASTIFTIVGPKLLGDATTLLFEGLQSKMIGGDGIDFDGIRSIILMILGLYGISAFCGYTQGFIMTSVAQKVTFKLRNDITKKLNKLPMKYFDKKNNGEVLSIITNDVDTLAQNLNQSITQIITAICTILGILIMMFTISGTLTVISLITLPISAFLLKGIIGKSQKYFKSQQELLGEVNGEVEEIYGGQNIVKAFNVEEKSIERFCKVNEKLNITAAKSQFLSGLMMPIMSFIGNISYVGVAIIGGALAMNGSITVGNIQSFIQYNRQFMQPVTQIAQISGLIQSMIAAAERVFELLEEPEEIQDATKNVDVKTLEGNIEFKNVHFGYNEDKIIINDFSSNAKNGQKVAIVGPTGAGKTTMVKLLMRFYDVNSGEILIDGVKTSQISRNDLRSIFGMVLQDTWLFGGTIKDNIKYGKEDATDEEVIAAAKAAHVHHFISTLPNGYDMVLNEETSNISQGQKQLLTIARVILANPKILILDEATSSIDTRTEVQIQNAMDNLMKGRTSFIIAHRLSTIKNADKILVMANGDIVEQGSHEELLALNGTYSNLYNSQFDEEEE